MLPLCLVLAMQSSTAPQTWYGPEVVSFPVAFAGNPYDPAKSDIRVRFVDGKGIKVERLAYFDATASAWKSVLVANLPGTYRPIMIRNGVEVDASPEPAFVELENKPIARGFIRLDDLNKGRFKFDDGKPYLPLGYNLGWQSPGLPDLPANLKLMGENGVNWSRIWACHWDGKNPWFPREGTHEGDTMIPEAFERWDQLVEASEKAKIGFQFVLFHHGQFSTKVNPNWQDHPWNKAKGGFLEKPADFFTDLEAKRRTKMWLRYAVARWGHSPAVMAWELFNEVEWVDARYENRWADVVAWHKEMADYLRSVDPYGHLVATSSTFEFPNLYDAVDFYQPHVYPSDVRTAISGFKVPADKPLFFGEFGPGVLDKKDQRMDVRDGIWAGLLSDHAGAGAFWTWEVVHKENLYGEFKIAADVVKESGLLQKPDARPMSIGMTTPGVADLTFNPGSGWAKAEQTSFVVQSGSKPAGLGGLPSFLQGPNKRDMFPEPLTFKFQTSKPGVFTLQLAQIAKAGAKLRFSLNGKQVAEKAFAPSEKDNPVADKLTVPYIPGTNEIQIENVEGDWVVMKSFTFSGMDFEASAQSLGSVDWLMTRITANPGANPKSVTLSNLGLVAGAYQMMQIDLEKGTKLESSLEIKGVEHRETLQMASPDVLVVFTKKS